MLTSAFPVDDLPRNYIWVLGSYVGDWQNAEDAEINAQVRSYSREWLLERDQQLRQKREELKEKEIEYQRLADARLQQNMRMTKDKFMDESAIRQRIEAGPLKQAQSLMQSAGQLVSGGLTDPKARMDICNVCPFKTADGRCAKCGCVLAAKTRVKKSSCPINRW
jgi:hypothetical protein